MFEKKIGESFPEISHKRIDSPRKDVFYNHIHNHCEILLFISGEANYNIDGQVYSPQAFDLLFIPAGTYHYLIPTASVPYENYVLGIDPKKIPAPHYQALFTPPFMVNIKDDRESKSFFKRLDLYSEIFTDDDFRSTGQMLVLEFITYLSYQKRNMRSVHCGSIHHIDKIISYITDHLEEKLDAEAIAAHFYLSASYVQNLFCKNMHIGLKKYISQKKIYAAHADLSYGKSPSEVCEKYRFGDYSVFYRLYKKTFGVSPSRNKF